MTQRLIAIFLICGIMYMPACKERSEQSQVASYDYESADWFAQLNPLQQDQFRKMDATAAEGFRKNGWLALVKDPNENKMTVSRYVDIPKGQGIDYYMFRSPAKNESTIYAVKFQSDYVPDTKQLKTFVYLKSFDFGSPVELSPGNTYDFKELPLANVQTTLNYDLNETDQAKVADQYALNQTKMAAMVRKAPVSDQLMFTWILSGMGSACLMAANLMEFLPLFVLGVAAKKWVVVPLAAVATVFVIGTILVVSAANAKEQEPVVR